MNARWPTLLVSTLALALSMPAFARDNGKNKDKDKPKDKKHDVARADHDDDDDDRDDGKDKVTVCHIPPGNAAARHTIRVSESAWEAHRKHGDQRGACDDDPHGDRFDRLDRNNDHLLSLTEWPWDRDAFARLDRDNDRMVSREEFRRF